MFPFRMSEWLKDYSIATAGTVTWDVSDTDLISAIEITPRVINPNAYVAVGHPLECVSAIELVNGSDVLFSMDSMAAQALAYYNTGRVPQSSMNYMALQWAMCPILILFGRRLWDKQYALDPTRFNNLQLKITHNVAACMTGATTGYLDVVAWEMDRELGELAGFLSSLTHYQRTIVASDIAYIDLPTDFPIRMLMSKCFSDTQAPEYQADHLKLTENHDKVVLLDADMEDLQNYVSTFYPPWVEGLTGQALTTDRNFWITPSFEGRIIPHDFGEANSVITPEATGGQKKIISAEATAIFEALVSGGAPHGSLPIAMGDQMEPGDWWKIDEGGSGRLKVTFASDPDTTPTWDLITQQARPYAE